MRIALRAIRQNNRHRRRARGLPWIASLEQSRVTPPSRFETRRRSCRRSPISAPIPTPCLRSAGIEPAMFSDPDNDLPFAAVGKLATRVREGDRLRVLRAAGRATRRNIDVDRTDRVGLDARGDGARRAADVISDSIRTSNTGVATMLEERQLRRIVPICRYRATISKAPTRSSTRRSRWWSTRCVSCAVRPGGPIGCA